MITKRISYLPVEVIYYSFFLLETVVKIGIFVQIYRFTRKLQNIDLSYGYSVQSPSIDSLLFNHINSSL
jgi:hypothetical protein